MEENKLVPDIAEKKRILSQRAKTLAKEEDSGFKTVTEADMLIFQLGCESYGIESRFVREVYMMKDYVPIPCTPAYVLGVINLRGKILSVLDIKKLFNLPDTGLSELNRVIVVYSGEMEFGILADSIAGMRPINPDDIQYEIPASHSRFTRYIRGVAEGNLILLDAAGLITDPAIIVNEEIGISANI